VLGLPSGGGMILKGWGKGVPSGGGVDFRQCAVLSPSPRGRISCWEKGDSHHARWDNNPNINTRGWRNDLVVLIDSHPRLMAHRGGGEATGGEGNWPKTSELKFKMEKEAEGLNLTQGKKVWFLGSTFRRVKKVVRESAGPFCAQAEEGRDGALREAQKKSPGD